ncbi:aspartate carbamoyltransferase [Candidatus Saccharibacteria bacterium]|nr:aspartate carbamoyltransferase [Candidatus Saccharibacteria bacterium]
MRHILESQQFDIQLIDKLFKRADEFRVLLDRKDPSLSKVLDGEMMFTIFYEPSTRTRMSFSAAAQHLGMKVVTTENARDFSSAVKGETLEDSIRVMCQYQPSLIVLRHHEDGAANKAAGVSTVPIINAGDGTGQHPTQALLDLYTINKELGKLDGLNIVIGGDLAHGRTARSLAYLLAKYPKNKITFVAPEVLKIDDDIKSYLTRHKISFQETENIREALPRADVVYWTRVQKERFDSTKLKGGFNIGVEEMKLLPKKSVLLHPLPRIDEISIEVDKDPRAAYFRQAGNGMFIRMALIEWALKTA